MGHIKTFENYLETLNEDTSATGGLAVGGMGAVVSAQPSSLPGTTVGPAFANTGGTIGSGDISIPFNGTNGDNVYQKLAAPKVMGKNHGSRTGKKSREKKLDMKALKNIFAKRQDYTNGEGNVDRPSKVMNFDDFKKNDINQIKK